MRKLFLTFPFFFVLILTGCDNTKSLSTPNIYGGTVTSSIEVLRSVVALRFESRTVCTATLIADDVAITAGHCLYAESFGFGPRNSEGRKEIEKRSQSNTFLAFGVDGDDIDAPTRRVVAWEVPHQWKLISQLHDERSYENVGFQRIDEIEKILAMEPWQDFALLRFEGGLPDGFVPAKLSTESPQLQDELKIAGYGSSERTNFDSGILKESVSVVSSHSQMEFKMINSIEHGICTGDSGGPAFQIEGGSLVLRGIASRAGAPCKNSFSTYNDVAQVLDWVKMSSETLRNKPPFPQTSSPFRMPIKLTAKHDSTLKLIIGDTAQLDEKLKCVLKKGEFIQVQEIHFQNAYESFVHAPLSLELQHRCELFKKGTFVYISLEHFEIKNINTPLADNEI